MSIEAMKQAIEALEESEQHYGSDSALRDATQILRAAIAETTEQDVQQEMECGLSPEQYEGIGRFVEGLLRVGAKITAIDPKTCLRSMPDGSINCGLDIRYDESPSREWVGLTDEEIDYMRQGAQGLNFVTFREFCIISRAIETKLKEKNS